MMSPTARRTLRIYAHGFWSPYVTVVDVGPKRHKITIRDGHLAKIRKELRVDRVLAATFCNSCGDGFTRPAPWADSICAGCGEPQA